ncbi:hypothetical protein K443DRAFT_13835 [Laccaria amethystina LaAM-08-1]|uniref:Uncharacterized protein n=1 Tax=Laccaria amethystina LaAM-08-1 TaxID=1095629 RepID=A0A0C9X6S9_9AGAR|nr:hypothetical protein K443DRAFT_13835 [Laccaria amethystina LaAM-08-1]
MSEEKRSGKSDERNEADWTGKFAVDPTNQGNNTSAQEMSADAISTMGNIHRSISAVVRW